MILKKSLFLVLLVFTVISIFSLNRLRREKLAVTKNNYAHPLIFFEKDTFYQGVMEAEKESKPFQYHVYGGVVPHHLFASFIIANFFSRLANQNPKTIILIGPNHYERGNYEALSSLYGWETPFGIVKPDEKIIKELVINNTIEINEKVLPNDHAVAVVMPFIKYYLPNSKVVPILLSNFMKEKDTAILSTNLKKYLDKDTILVAAVDFSHYLTSEKAIEKDTVTFKLMENFDTKKLFELNSAYLDSPPSIATLLQIMKENETTNSELLQHTNSGQMQKNNSIEVTSYFSIFYYK